MIKAIIFDCFGVVLSDGFDAAYSSFGGDVAKDKDFIKQIVYDVSSGNLESSAPAIAKRLGITEEQWRAANFGGMHIDHTVLAYAKELRESYKVAMLSNIGKGGLGRFFDPGFLEQYFDPIVESAAIGYAKPEPQAYETTADLLGVRYDECVMIDDRPDYIEGAQAVGMQAILFKNLEQLKNDLKILLTS